MNKINIYREENFDFYFGAIKREGKENLLQYLKNNGYFTSPSSSQFHGAYEGGNIDHSINVTKLMFKLKPILAPEISNESIVICGLFHDLGKASYYGKPEYTENILKSGKRSESKPYEHNNERLNIPHEITSLHILASFIELTEEETFAIVYHNGLYTALGYAVKGNETKLQQLLHMCDMWASHFIETKEEIDLDSINF